jgi:hypothetical protein
MKDGPKTSNYSIGKKYKLILLAITLLVAVSLVAWLIGKHSNPSNQNSPAAQTQSSTSASTTDVKSLISYTLPDGWVENVCSGSGATVYIIPSGATLDCSANPSAPIKAYVDPQNTTDCQQLKPASTQGIKKHVCISLYISGHKSLKASTEYAASSLFNTDTTVSDYFINTGKGVAALDYTYTSANSYQIGFDELARSVRTQ